MWPFYPITLLAVAAAATWARVWGARGDPMPAQAPLIVVLGCQAWASGASAELQARSHQGAALYRAGIAPRVLCSGGYSLGLYSEPEAMRAELVDAGVPPEVIDLDHDGRSTRETVATLRELGVAGAVAVSSPYHLPRIAAEARRQGVALTTNASPRGGGRRRYLKQTVREVLALWWYAVTPPRARVSRRAPS